LGNAAIPVGHGLLADGGDLESRGQIRVPQVLRDTPA